MNLAKNPQSFRPEDDMFRASKQNIRKVTTLPNGEKRDEEVELVTEYSWRNFFSTINFAKIMQKLSKGRSHRIWMLVQYKSSAVLKRVLRVNQPLLQLHVLKLIKSQVPFCGRKWRQCTSSWICFGRLLYVELTCVAANMKVITSIYLSCRPDLRDEWLAGTEPDDAGDAQVSSLKFLHFFHQVDFVQAQEQALRHLVKFCTSPFRNPATFHRLTAYQITRNDMVQRLPRRNRAPCTDDQAACLKWRVYTLIPRYPVLSVH